MDSLHHNRVTLFVGVAVVACFVSACHGMGSQAWKEYTFLPGECLASNELTYYLPYDDTDYLISSDNKLIFRFKLDLNNYRREEIDLKAKTARTIPANELFGQFGSKQKTVKSAFDAQFADLLNNWNAAYKGPYFSMVTILYNDGMKLTANKEFAGYLPGEDIASCISDIGEPLNVADEAGALLEIPMDFTTVLSDCLVFSIPMDGCEIDTSFGATFELEVPVKVIMYLNWLNDRISDPDAPVVYQDEILHCTFSTKLGLHKVN